MNSSYMAGYNSFLIGLKYSDNPYLGINDREKANAWWAGWLDAQWENI